MHLNLKYFIYSLFKFMYLKLIELCLIEINKLNVNIDKNRYKSKYTNEYYLNFIFYMLNDINKWSFITKLKEYNSSFKYHYKTIYNKFLYWSKNFVFKKAFYNYLFNNNTNLLLIDTTSINNKFGTEDIVINPEYKKKKVTKLSIVSNNKNFIHSIEVFNLKTKNDNYNTAVHDSKMISQSLKNIKIKNESKYFYLLGDKAYKTKDNYELNNKNIKIITPDKKNAKNKNCNFNNNKLKKRIKVENVINKLKRFERIKTRKDKNINTYMSWVYISALINNINVNE